MAERADTRRRISVYLVALVASAATIATSPAQVQSRIEASSSATVTLDAASPRATGRFVLTLSPEVLPEQTPSGPQPRGTVTFTPDMRNAGVTTSGENPVLISVKAVGIADRPKVEGSSSSWSIEDLCRLAEPCLREFEVGAEWLRPEAGRTISVPIAATFSVLYDRWESPPPGAMARWETGAFATASASPTLPTSLDLGNVVLGRDSPMAARHLELTASAELLADRTNLDLTAYVSADLGAARQPPATVTLIPDPSRDDQNPQPMAPAVPAGTFVAPFTGCVKGQACTRGFTVLAEWAGLEANEPVPVDWSFEAVARFPGAETVPDGAALTAKIDKTVDLDATSARLRGEARGSFELGEPTQGRRIGRVRLRLDAPSLGDRYLGAPLPAVAVIRVWATVKDPRESAQLILWRPSGVESIPVPEDGSEVTSIDLPLAECRTQDACSGHIEISVESKAAREATISWEVEADLPLPDAPARGALTITVLGNR